MNKYPGMNRYLLALVFGVCSIGYASASPGEAAEMGEGDRAIRFSGTLGLYAKYNSNLTLVDEKSTGLDQKDAFILEPSTDLRLSRSWGPDWWLDLGLSGQADWHAEHAEENWFFNRVHFSLGRALGEDSVNLSSEVRYFTVPDRDSFDFARHTGLLTYKKVLSPLWQVRVGYDNIVTHYPRSERFDYAMNSFFAEIRHTWSLDFSTYYTYDFQSYRGSFDPLENNPNSSPDEGSRHTGESGFDWLISGVQTLSGMYLFQFDVSEKGVQQIGDVEGSEDSQDNEAEFDLSKHKVTLLYSRRLSHKLTLSSYAEWIHKKFHSEDDPPVPREKRTDALFLSSTHLKIRWSGALDLNLRYLFRTNRSSLDRQDYQDHIVFFGPEYRF